MNSVQLLGNLARDPEIRFTKTGRAMARFTVACTNTYIPYGAQEPREITDFVPCVAWGNLAETCGNNLAKGSRVFVEGRYSTRSYETPDGQKRDVTEVVANFVAQTMGSEHQGNGPAAPSYGAPQAGAQQPKAAAPGAGFDSMGSSAPDDDIPF